MVEVKKGIKSFYLGDSEENPLAEMTFVTNGEKRIIVDHTYVPNELSGKGIGKKLLKAMVEWARHEKKKIIPLCPYVKVQMEKNPEYQDVLDK